MITAFSQNDNNKSSNEENFTRNELYDIWTALNHYRTKFENQEMFNRCDEINSTISKIKKLIEINLYSE